MTEIWAKVASYIDPSMLAINVGSDRGVSEDDEVYLYRSVNVTDPDTRESLGSFKMRILGLKVNFVQEGFCVAYVTDVAKADTQGFNVAIAGAWQRRKRLTDKETEVDINTVLVNIGDEVMIELQRPKDAD